MSSCPYCRAEVQAHDIYCPSCGRQQPSHLKQKKRQGRSLRSFLLFYFLLTIPLLLMRLPIFEDLWEIDVEGEITVDLAFEAYMIVLISVFTALNWKRMAPLLSFRRVKLPMLGLVIVMALAYALFVYYSTSALMDAAEFDGSSLTYLQDKSLSVFIVLIVMMAVVPGIFEELAFRGFLLTQVQNYVSYTAAALVTSMLFFFIHFAFLSFFWMLPFALGMCYLRLRTGTLWYGMFWHFLHNATVTLMSIWLA